MEFDKNSVGIQKLLETLNTQLNSVQKISRDVKGVTTKLLYLDISIDFIEEKIKPILLLEEYVLTLIEENKNTLQRYLNMPGFEHEKEKIAQIIIKQDNILEIAMIMFKEATTEVNANKNIIGWVHPIRADAYA